MVVAWFRLLCFLLACGLLVPVAGFANSIPEKVAKVGNIAISKYELGREVQRIMPLNSTFHGGIPKEKVDDVKRQALNSLIERAYMVQYAIANEISIPNSAVEERLAKLRERFSDDAGLQKALGEEALSDFRASIYRLLLARKAEEIVVNEKARLDEAEMRKVYQDRQEMFQQPERFRASQILVKVDPALPEEERQKLAERAAGLLEKAKAGEGFYNLAYYNSDDPTKFVGGDMGHFFRGQTLPQLEAAIVKMQPGEISELLETRFGYHIIQLTEREEARLMTFEEAQERIRSTIEPQKRKGLREEWIAALKEQYPVEIFME